MSAMLPSRQLWAQGPHIVAIGGGTGLSTMLRGLKKYTKNLTAIVTVSDDGGGSGMLRRDIGMLPPGDIRHCMESLANTEPVMQQLLTYRFESGTLRGQCFGNLLLAALNGVTGSFDEAVRSMGQVLAISGTVIPVTTTDVRLTATFENGAYVVGESNIFGFKKQQDCRIDHVELLPAHPKALPDALDAIAAADLILLGPGSLYTSIIPNLLVDGVAEAIAASDAQKIYVCNIMTQDGETEGYTAADHLAALLRHGTADMVELCLANSSPIPPELAERYRAEGAEVLTVDVSALRRWASSWSSVPWRRRPATLPATIPTRWRAPFWTSTAPARYTSTAEGKATASKNNRAARSGTADAAVPLRLPAGIILPSAKKRLAKASGVCYGIAVNRRCGFSKEH